MLKGDILNPSPIKSSDRAAARGRTARGRGEGGSCDRRDKTRLSCGWLGSAERVGLGGKIMISYKFKV